MDFAAVYERHALLVRRLLTRRGVRAADLDDVAQDAFVVIHRMLPRFEGRSSLETWLHAVSWRVASHYHRRRQTRALAACESDDVIDPLLDYECASAERLHESLAQLEAEQRDLLALHEVGGLSIAELADITRSARSTVRERLERARLAIERRLRSHSGIVEPADGSALRAAPRVATGAASFDYSCDDCDLSCVGDTVVALWRGAPTGETVATLTELMLQTARHQSDGITYLAVVEPTCTVPEREGRDAIVRLVSALGPSLRAAAFAVEAVDVLKVVPPIINACVFLARSRLSTRFFGDVAPAASWLARHSTQAQSARLEAHVASLRTP